MADKKKDDNDRNRSNALASAALAAAMNQANAEQLLQSMQAASLAAAGGLGPFGFSPFYPYGTMYSLGNALGGLQPSQSSADLGIWPGMVAPDYLMNLAALQTLAASTSHTNESFADILSKMPQVPIPGISPSMTPKNTALSTSVLSPAVSGQLGSLEVCSEKINSRRNSACVDVKPVHSTVNSIPNSTSIFQLHKSLNGTSSSSGAAGSSSNSLTGDRTTMLSSDKLSRKTPKLAVDQDAALCVLKKEEHSKENNLPAKLQHRPEQLTPSSNSALPLKACKPESEASSSGQHSALSSPQRATSKGSSASTALGSSSATAVNSMSSVFPSSTEFSAAALAAASNALTGLGDVKFDPSLLNASAMAWAALSSANPFLLAAAGVGLPNLLGVNSTTGSLNSSTSTGNNNSGVTGTKKAEQEAAKIGSKNNATTKNAVPDHGHKNVVQSKSAFTSETRLRQPTAFYGSPSSSSLSHNSKSFDPKDHVDVTIDSVIKQQEATKNRLMSSRSLQDGSATGGPIAVPFVRGGRGTGRGRGRGRGNSGGGGATITVREQLALKRQAGEASASSSSSTYDEKLTVSSSLATQQQFEALDLSKKSVQQTCNGTYATTSERTSTRYSCRANDNSFNALSAVTDRGTKRSQSPNSGSSSPALKKRRIADETLCKIPLEHGWRRQTCVRSISASGVRGDVIYYAPCGKKLGSYAEVLRYLQKYNLQDIRREHFSFSSRIIVGEFIQVRNEDGKNNLVKMDEAEVKRTVDSLQNGAFGSGAESPVDELSDGGCLGSTSPGLSSADETEDGLKKKRGRKPNVEQELAEQMRQQAQKNAEINSTLASGRHGRGRGAKNNTIDRQAAWMTKRLERERHSQLLEERRKKLDAAKSQKVSDALQKAKDKELQKQQLLQLKQQEEVYIRQMMAVVDMEREKQRQQLLISRIIDARKKQEEKQRAYAEKLIRREERLAAKNAQIIKLKQLRQPAEDLDCDDLKELPDLERMTGLKLPGKAFADLLMSMEFLNNFAHVLRLDKNELPTLEFVQRGLVNEKRYVPCLIDLTKLLLTLMLEYPGLPAGKEGRTFLGQIARDLTVTDENLTELLRMFLCSRDAEGKKLGAELSSHTFEALSCTTKAACLAYMCNELLYCRNVVREIETNIEEAAKLKSERWIVEGKLRQLNVIRNRKRSIRPDTTNSSTSVSAVASTSNNKDSSQENSDVEQPPQQQRPVKSRRVSEASDVDSDSESVKASEHGSEAKACSSVGESLQDEALSIDELDKKFQRLEKDVSSLRSKLAEKSSRVRSLPFGQDRYHRTYWMLPSVGSILVEGVESGGPGSHWVTDRVIEGFYLTKSKVAECGVGEDEENLQDIRDCMESMVNCVASAHDGKGSLQFCGSYKATIASTSSVETTDFDVIPSSLDCLDGEGASSNFSSFKLPSNDLPFPHSPLHTAAASQRGLHHTKGHSAFYHRHFSLRYRRPLYMRYQFGWWQIEDEDQLNLLQGALHHRGFRERNLNRAIAKHKDSIWNEKPLSSSKPFKFTAASPTWCRQRLRFGAAVYSDGSVDQEVDIEVVRKCFREIMTMEQKVFHANIHFRNWRPLAVDCASEDSLDTNYDEDPSSVEDGNEDLSNKPIDWRTLSPKQLIDLAKDRLAQLELNIERRYINPPFYKNKKVPTIEEISNTANPGTENSNHSGLNHTNGCENGQSEEEEEELEDVEERVPIELVRWRSGVLAAGNSSQLMMCVEQLDANIAWDKSIMKASCQICSGGENDSQLLLCDGCDLAYHTYCFKPVMDNIPSGDWFCPVCITKATEKQCCFLCRKTAGKFMTCGACPRTYHLECLPTTPKKTKNGTTWFCTKCIKEHRSTILPNSSEKEEPASSGKKKNDSKRKPAAPRKPKASANSSAASTPKPSNSSTPVYSSSPLNWEEICSIILAELDAHKDAWPFKLPVDTKAFPLYRKVIKRPMDLQLISNKLKSHKYEDETQFTADVKLIFDNCKIFNEDDSPVAKCGLTLTKFFKKRWKELKESQQASSKLSQTPTKSMDRSSSSGNLSKIVNNSSSNNDSLNCADLFDFL